MKKNRVSSALEQNDEKALMDKPLDESIEYKFATRTSMHGLAWVAESEQHLRKFLWIMVVIAFLGLLSYQTYDNVKLYISHPTAAKIEIKRDSKLQFPSVTFCNLNVYRKSKLRDVSKKFLRIYGSAVITGQKTSTNMSVYDDVSNDELRFYLQENPSMTETLNDLFLPIAENLFHNYSKKGFTPMLNTVFAAVILQRQFADIDHDHAEDDHDDEGEDDYYYEADVVSYNFSLTGKTMKDCTQAMYNRIAHSGQMLSFYEMQQDYDKFRYEDFEDDDDDDHDDHDDPENRLEPLTLPPPLGSTPLPTGTPGTPSAFPTPGSTPALPGSTLSVPFPSTVGYSDDFILSLVRNQLQYGLYDYWKEYGTDVKYYEEDEDSFQDFAQHYDEDIHDGLNYITDALAASDVEEIHNVLTNLHCENELYHMMELFMFYISNVFVKEEQRETLNKLVTNKKLNFLSLLSFAGFDISTSLLYCRYGKMKCSANDFLPITTEMGRCYIFNTFTTNSSAVKYQTGPGKDLGLNVAFDTQQYERFYVRGIGSSESDVGLKILLHNDIDYPNIEQSGNIISPGKTINMEIEQSNDYNLPVKKWGQCNDTEIVDDISKKNGITKYALSSCIYDCKAKFIYSNCGCYTYYDRRINETMSRNVTCKSYDQALCVGEYSNKFQIDSHCKHCTIPCSIRKFRQRTSYGELQKYLFDATMKKKAKECSESKSNSTSDDNGCLDADDWKSNIVFASIYYPDLIYEARTQLKGIEFITIFSNIGGTMGCCIGMSFVTLIEFIDFIVMKCIARRRLSKARKRAKEDLKYVSY
ncbi:hypothetical protein SNEBB_007576 [Seison nebaliae]|nr:hypothetical protein SNEBB_007576 [Seison nebaliae]